MLQGHKMQKAFETAIQTEVQKAFDHAAYHRNMMAITMEYFDKKNIGIVTDDSVFIVSTGNTGSPEEQNKFPTFAQAYAFAFKTYVEKLTGLR